MATSAKPSFKELMSQMKQETTEAPRIKIEGNKKKLDDRYTFNQGWYDALLNTDMVLSTNNEAAGLKIDPLEQRQIGPVTSVMNFCTTTKKDKERCRAVTFTPLRRWRKEFLCLNASWRTE